MKTSPAIEDIHIVSVGAGNLATQLVTEMHRKGLKIVQVYSRTETSARLLAEKTGAEWCTDITRLSPEADIYLFSVKDSVLPDLIAQMPFRKGLWLHTAGSVPMDIFKSYPDRYGVIYPLQTFSKTGKPEWNRIPFFTEGSDEDILNTVNRLASLFSGTVCPLSSDKRKYIHLSAVFACNFTNLMYTIADRLTDNAGIPFSVLLPLIDETAQKVHRFSPLEAQTGPAVRYDENVMEKHVSLLKANPDWQDIYQLLSQNIYKLQEESINDE